MTTMHDLCLKFTDEAEAQQVLTDLGLLQPFDSALIPSIPIDVIGVISRPIGEPDADGVQQTEQLPGWHVNVLLAGDVPEALMPYIVTPAQRMRVWA